MAAIDDNLQAVRERIARAARAARRDPAGVRLLAVSKTHPPAALEQAWRAGQTAFGESYVQEAIDKMTALAALPLEWHLVGPLQSNKTRPAAAQAAAMRWRTRRRFSAILVESLPMAARAYGTRRTTLVSQAAHTPRWTSPSCWPFR